MLIEILYIPGCPNHQPVVRILQKLLRSQAVDAAIHQVAIADEAMAHSLCFPGSPTVRINGADAEPGVQPKFGLACRLYSGRGLPSEEALLRAINEAKQKEASV